MSNEKSGSGLGQVSFICVIGDLTPFFLLDANSRITAINSFKDGLASYTYDQADQLTGVTYSTPQLKHAKANAAGLILNAAGNVTGVVWLRRQW